MILREKAVDHVLEVAETRFGLCALEAPGWVRDRVASFLDSYVERTGCSWDDVGVRVGDERSSMMELVEALRVGETRFFRDPEHVVAAIDHVCAAVSPLETIRVLSAGCSTGEEAFTAAIMLSEKARRFEVVGCDRSTEAIHVASQGEYGKSTLRQVPSELLRRHFYEESGRYVVRRPLKSQVKFEVCDLVRRLPDGPFHIVLFRNVLIYLSQRSGAKVGKNLAGLLTPDGLLVSAASEVVRLSAVLAPVRLSREVVVLRRASKR